MFRRDSATMLGLAGGGMGIAAAFVGRILPGEADSLLVTLLLGLLLAPVGTIAALASFYVYKRWPQVSVGGFSWLGIAIGAFCMAAIDLLLAARWAEFGMEHTIGGGDLILGMVTGGMAGHLSKSVARSS